jgi:hypothetical protein
VNVNSSESKRKCKQRLPLIRCSCGAEILLVPNVKMMGEAIENHADAHKQKVKDHEEAEAERVRNDLIVKTLEKACSSR